MNKEYFRGVNLATIHLVKKFEGLETKIYKDSAGLPTIGYGHLLTAEENRRGDWKQSGITEEAAQEVLKNDLKTACDGVGVKLGDECVTTLSDNEFGAVVSLVFNVGARAFGRSNACAALRRGDIEEFLYQAFSVKEGFNKITKDGKKVLLQGLVARRAAEQGLFQAVE